MLMSKDVYPRNHVTMMPEHRNAPKYYDGKFLTYDYKDMVPLERSRASGGSPADRPVVFKPDHIENVQTKKKYATLKGKTSVPLHLINDVNSELFQRSLYNNYQSSQQDSVQFFTDVDQTIQRTQGHINSGKTQSSSVSDISSRRSIDDTACAISSFSSSKSSNLFEVKDRKASLNDDKLRSGKIYIEPNWMTSEILREKVANTMKFMGKASYQKTPRNREYDINFG